MKNDDLGVRGIQGDPDFQLALMREEREREKNCGAAGRCCLIMTGFICSIIKKLFCCGQQNDNSEVENGRYPFYLISEVPTSRNPNPKQIIVRDLYETLPGFRR